MSTQTIPAGAQWFALHTLSGQENKVKTYIERFKTAEELDDSIFEVLLPTEVVSEVKNGKKSSKVRKLYPGYVFIQMHLFDEEKKLINKPWYFVKEVAGVAPNVTAVAPVRFVPVIVTDVPPAVGPLVGATLVTVGTPT